MKINNTKYALLSASQDFMVTVLMLGSGIVTDRLVRESTCMNLECLILTTSREVPKPLCMAISFLPWATFLSLLPLP